MAVFAVMAVSPAVAAEIKTDTTQKTGDLVMSGDSNKIVSQGSIAEYWKATGFLSGYWNTIAELPGFIAGSTNPDVTVSSGDITMSTTTGYNAIVGSVTGDVGFNLLALKFNAYGGRPTIIAENGDVLMDGPANAVMLGSTIKGVDITLENSKNQVVSVGTVANGVLGDFAGKFMPADLGKVEGIFNIVQGSNLTASGSVTMNTATDTAVNNLKVNVIAGGRGDISTLVSNYLKDKISSSFFSDIAGAIVNGMADDDFGSTITATENITMGGGASVIVDTTLSDLADFATADDKMTGLQSLLAGKSGNSTPVTLTAGKDINLNSIINMAYAAQGGVALSAGSNILADGALNVFGGKTKLTANNIKLTPGTSVSINKLVGELKQLDGLMPVGLSSITSDLGTLADQDVNASIVAGGAYLKATALTNVEEDQDAGGDIVLGGTAGIVVNTEVTDILGAAKEHLATDDPHKMLFAKDVLMSGTATKLEADRDINMGAQLNVLHGGGFTKTPGENALTITAGNDVTLHGAANLVSGNVVVNAGSVDDEGNIKVGDIHMQGYPLNSQLAGAVAGLANGYLQIDDPSSSPVSGMIGKLAEKGSFNVVTGGATLNATGDIIMDAKSVDDVGKVGNINVVLDTQFTDVITAVINGEPSAILPTTDKDVIKPTTTLTAGGDIDLLGRVNVVNGLRGDVKVTAGGNVNLQGNLSMVSGNASVTGKTININTDEAEKYKMYVDSSELSILPDFTILDQIGGSIEGVAMNAAVVAGGANLTSEGVDDKGNGITIGGTVGLLMNTPVADAIKEFNPLSSTKNPFELEIGASLLQKGTATTLTATTGNINVGSQFNLMHGGGFVKDAVTKEIVRGENSLILNAKAGDVNVEGTANVVSGNVEVYAKDITMTGEVLSGGMADAANGLVGSLISGMDIPGADKLTSSGVLNKLIDKGSVNMVTGGALLDATGDIIMTGKSVDDVGKIGNINAVIDTEIVDVLEAKDGQLGSLVHGGGYMTTLQADGNIKLEGRVNLVNGTYVTLNAGKDVDLNGNLSMISGGAKVTGNNIKLNDDETGKLQMYFDSEELGAILPAGSPITEMMDRFGVTDLLGTTGVNAAIVAGGANLTATGDITTGGTVSMLVNTPLSEVMKELETWTEIKDETWMVNQLLQTGTATSVHADGNINLASRLNLMHGGNFGENGAALSLTAGNDVKMSGSANVVSGNVKVEAGSRDAEGNIIQAGNITMTGEPLKFDTGDALDGVTGGEMLSKLAAQGSTNIVTGGATLKATNNIKLDSMANFVLDTEAVDLTEVIMNGNMNSVVEGGNKLTSLNADGNIDLTGRLNMVNGAYVALNAGKDVNINGTLNIVSGKAKVNGANINLNGQTSVGLDWGEIIPGVVGDYVDGTGLTDKLNKGVNGNLVLGGSKLEAANDIKMTGMASVVTNVPLGSAFEALNKKMDETWQPELWLMKDMLNDGVATTLEADGNIEMGSRLNMLHGGNMADANAALKLTAGKEVIIAGTANIISGNTQVIAGEGIKITGKTGVGFDWNQVVDVLPDKYAGYGELAGQMGILGKLNKGVNGNVIAGGATLTAESGDITMEGMATAVVDVTAENVLTAVETMNGTPIMEGGAEDTLIKAKNGSINLNSRLNLVNGGQVTLDANQNVNMNGTFNVVSGNANVVAGGNIEMNAQNKVGVDISPMLDGHYAEIAKDLGMADVLKNGVSSNIVAGGAKLEAEGDVKMSGVATAIVDTTASNVISAVKGDNLGELMKGGKSKTEVIAGGDIKLESQLNVVNGGNTKNAGGVHLSAGKDVLVGGKISVVNRAEITTGNMLTFDSDMSVVKNSSISATTDGVYFTGDKAELTNVNFNESYVSVQGANLLNTAGSTLEGTGSLSLESGSLVNAGSIELDIIVQGGQLSYTGDAEFASIYAISGVLNIDSSVTINDTLVLGAVASTFSMENTADSLTLNINYNGAPIAATNGIALGTGLNINVMVDDLQDIIGKEYDLFDGIAEFEQLLGSNLTFTDGSDTVTVDIEETSEGFKIVASTPIPEPTTATLSLLALAALAARRRRK